MYWSNLLHIYQPPGQKKEIINQVVKESYKRILTILQTNPFVRLSLNICASLTEQLVEYGYQDFLKQIKKLVETGQIELVGSAAYHPLLPLLPETEISRQVKLNEDINQKYFGKSWQPKGFFLPELAYSKKTADVIQNLGYQWIVLDEIAYQGQFGQVLFDKIYKKGNLKIIFRNRGLSLLFFGEWLDSVDKFFSSIKKDGRSDEFLITAFDGENLGHHHKYLADLWEKILQDPKIQNITYSEYIDLLKDKPLIEVEPLDSSWSTEIKDLKEKIPYPLWQHPENKLHQYQWQLTNLFIGLINQVKDNSNYKEARELLDKALASDQYWWASIKPLRNFGLIEDNTRQYLKIFSLLQKSINVKTRQQIESIIQKIFKEVKNRRNISYCKNIEK